MRTTCPASFSFLDRMPVERLYIPRVPEDETCGTLVKAAGEQICFVEEDVHLDLGTGRAADFCSSVPDFQQRKWTFGVVYGGRI